MRGLCPPLGLMTYLDLLITPSTEMVHTPPPRSSQKDLGKKYFTICPWRKLVQKHGSLVPNSLVWKDTEMKLSKFQPTRSNRLGMKQIES
jgi:hypothetical protein